MTPEEWRVALETVPEDRRYDVIERAAIHEYCGGMPRAEAEQTAIDEWRKSQQPSLI